MTDTKPSCDRTGSTASQHQQIPLDIESREPVEECLPEQILLQHAFFATNPGTFRNVMLPIIIVSIVTGATSAVPLAVLIRAE